VRLAGDARAPRNFDAATGGSGADRCGHRLSRMPCQPRAWRVTDYG
jgi:hypothetical protein